MSEFIDLSFNEKKKLELEKKIILDIQMLTLFRVKCLKFVRLKLI